MSAPRVSIRPQAKTLPALAARGMHKKFGRLPGLEDVSFRLQPGDFHALLGENGAGKSTLVKCIMGYHRADAGRISLDETDVIIGSPRDAQALGIGIPALHARLGRRGNPNAHHGGTQFGCCGSSDQRRSR